MTQDTVLPLGRFVDPAKVITHFHLREGDIVADFGAGSGFFSKALSGVVGDEGKVYACEIQKSLVEKIGELLRNENLANVEVLWCDLEAENGSKIPTETLDAAILVNTLFQLEDREAALKEVARTLRKGGKFFVVDWSESFAGMGPQPDQVVTESDAKGLVEQLGFTFERSYDAGDHHYGLAFRKG